MLSTLPRCLFLLNALQKWIKPGLIGLALKYLFKYFFSSNINYANQYVYYTFWKNESRLNTRGNPTRSLKLTSPRWWYALPYSLGDLTPYLLLTSPNAHLCIRNPLRVLDKRRLFSNFRPLFTWIRPFDINNAWQAPKSNLIY